MDILVNNTGIQQVARVENFPVERWDAIIAINLSSAFHATRLALPGMQAKNWGRIINVASVQKQVDAQAAAQGISTADATTLCAAAGSNVRGVDWNMDGGWAAQ